MSIGRTPQDVVVITGTGGMGLSISRRLGTGRHLVLADSSPDSMRSAASTLRNEGHFVTEVQTDVSNAAAVQQLADTAASLGQVRAIVHTAGVSPVQASTAQIVAVDVLGTAHVLDAFLPHVQQGTTCVCIASMAGTMTQLPPDQEMALATTPTAELAALPLLDPDTMDPAGAYGVAKRANQVRVQAASIPWGAQGGRVISISPGIISTPMGQQELAGPSGEAMTHMTNVSGSQRLGTPEDIATTVEFLVSPAASFITGTDLLVDGGVIAAMAFGG
jgi:NAD(P)-dependent dehydrogenase (short-subunit alcohol dehydrogenase family)